MITRRWATLAELYKEYGDSFKNYHSLRNTLYQLRNQERLQARVAPQHGTGISLWEYYVPEFRQYMKNRTGKPGGRRVATRATSK